jgi:hypothetical protein
VGSSPENDVVTFTVVSVAEGVISTDHDVGTAAIAVGDCINEETTAKAPTEAIRALKTFLNVLIGSSSHFS